MNHYPKTSLPSKQRVDNIIMNNKWKNIKTSTPTKSKQHNANFNNNSNQNVENPTNNNNNSNNVHFYSNMMKDFGDLENFQAIPENNKVQNEIKYSNNSMNILETAEQEIMEQNNNKYSLLKTRTDFINSKGDYIADNSEEININYMNKNQYNQPLDNINNNEIPVKSYNPISRDNMKVRSNKYKADLAAKLVNIQWSWDNPKITRLLGK